MVQQEKLNDKLPLFYEVCKKAEESDNPVQVLKEAIAADKRISAIIGYCANPQYKLPLPIGMPPYKPSEQPLGLAEIGILNQHDKLLGLFNQNLKQFKREELFVMWLERMSAEEAEIMVQLKDQTLHAMFPKLTKMVLAESLGWDLEKFQSMLQRAGVA